MTLEPDISQFSNKEFTEELRLQAIKHQNLLAATATLNFRVKMALQAAGGAEQSELHDDTVEEIIPLVLAHCASGVDPEAFDMVRAVRLLLCAAVRLSSGALRQVDRITNPKNQEGPDEPLII